MHIILILAVLYGIGYGLYYTAIYLNEQYKVFRAFLRRTYHKHYTQKKYDRTLIGRVEKTLRQIKSKKQEMLTAIKSLQKDASDHEALIGSLNEKLKQDQLPYIAETIKKEMEIQTQKTNIIKSYINLFEKCVIPIQREENGMEALFEILSFNQGSRNVDSYANQYQELSSKIRFFSKYDFINMSRNIVTEMNQSFRAVEAGGALRYATELNAADQLSENFSPSLASEEEVPPQGEGITDLEALVLKDFENSLEDFETLKQDFDKLFKLNIKRRAS